MEGNTYDILQTERLIRFGEEAAGKDRKEALMILNHKEAIQYVVDNLDEIGLRRPDLFAIHALLSDGLLADPAMPVGILHSSYRPLDDAVTIAEPRIDIALFAPSHAVHCRLHVVVDTPPRHATKDAEGVPMGIE
jgi:hypothetical protein